MNQIEDVRTCLQQLLKSIEVATTQKQIADRRRAPWRYEWQGMATVRCVESDGLSEPLYVLISHISMTGMDFRCSREMERGQKVLIILELEDGNLEIHATVKHSTGSIGKNIIGVSFELEQTSPTGNEDKQEPAGSIGFL